MFLKQEIYNEIGFSFPETAVFEKTDGNLKVCRENGKINVFYQKESDLARAALLVKAYGADGDFCIEDKTHFNDLCFMVDCSRNGVITVETAKKLIRNISMLGYNSMMLYTEDTYEVDGEPSFGYLRGRYTKDEIKEIDAYALQFGIELIPCIQT
ncbi:MAG: beta-N-acetylhexosaminidase, partial [Clostridia bacterium]|nr:beta-N-acetylhexosaminidase [Clostridia bacterium]